MLTPVLLPVLYFILCAKLNGSSSELDDAHDGG
jgi:hypothetical protein